MNSICFSFAIVENATTKTTAHEHPFPLSLIFLQHIMLHTSYIINMYFLGTRTRSEDTTMAAGHNIIVYSCP